MSTTTVTSRKAKNLALETVLALGLGAAGGVALAVAPGQSGEKPTGKDASPRETAQIVGGLGVAGGAVLLGHVVWVAAAGADDVSEPVITEEVRAADGAKQPCGTEPAGAGALIATVDRKEIELGDFPSGALELNLRSRAELLCGDPSAGGSVATLDFALKGDEDVRIELGRYALKHCVAATTARRQLRLADTQLQAAADGQRVARAAKLINDASALVTGLPLSDPEVAELQLEAGRLRAAATGKAAAVSDALVKQALAKIEVGASDAASSALEAIEVSSLNNAKDRARADLYSALGRQREPSRYAALSSLVEQDQGALECLDRRSGCSPSLTAERWLEMVSPLAQSAAESVGQRAAKLDVAAKNVAKAQNAKTLVSFDDAVAQARVAADTCNVRLGAVVAACAGLNESRAQAQAFADAHEGQLTKLRKEIAEKQRAEAFRRTTARWRGHFAQCSQLAEAIRSLDSVASCDSNCQSVVSRMRAQREKLRAFDYSEVVDEPDALQRLVNECNAAGCETCP